MGALLHFQNEKFVVSWKKIMMQHLKKSSAAFCATSLITRIAGLMSGQLRPQHEATFLRLVSCQQLPAKLVGASFIDKFRIGRARMEKTKCSRTMTRIKQSVLMGICILVAGHAAKLYGNIIVPVGGIQAEFHNFAGFASGLNFYPTINNTTFSSNSYSMDPSSTSALNGGASAQAGINSFTYNLGTDSFSASGSTYASIACAPGSDPDAEQTIYFTLTFTVDNSETYHLYGNVGTSFSLTPDMELSLATYDPASDVALYPLINFYTNVNNGGFDEEFL